MLKYVITVVLAAICIAFITVLVRKKQNDKRARMRAAAVLIREKRLDEDLKKDEGSSLGRLRPVVQLSWKDASRRSYLFDPSEPITIGRDPVRNQIGVRQDDVTSEHCRIVMYKGRPVIEDLNSANGTWISRGLSRYRIEGKAYLKNGDRIIIGGLSIRYCMFRFDTAYI